MITIMIQKRIEGLDWLRGLMALCIMLYHYTSWVYGEMQSDTFLGRIGIYGVPIFYVISGLSLSYVYGSKLINLNSIRYFFVKRFFRIVPLLILITLYYIFITWILSGIEAVPSIRLILLNLTGLFGLFAPSEYIAIGAWSIGNEIAFYLIFPLIIWIFNRSQLYGYVVTALSILIGYLFSSWMIDPNSSLASQNDQYVNPLNQLFFFCLGICLFYVFKNYKFSRILLISIIIPCVLFLVFFSVVGNQIEIVVGINRLLFSIASVAITLFFYKFTFNISSWLSKLLTVFGEISYSVYLVHPIVFHIMERGLRVLNLPNSVLLFTVSVSITLFVSYILHKYFELYFIRIGRKGLNESSISGTGVR